MMKLAVSWEVKRITTKFEFKIARSAESFYDVVIVKITDGEQAGYGEAAPSRRYHDSTTQVTTLLENLTNEIISLPVQDAELRQAKIEALFSDSFSLQAALDMAFWDLHAKQLGKPLHQVLGAEIEMPISSYTIGISDLDMIKPKLDGAISYPILKIKLGSPQDEEIMGVIRQRTDKILRVDANEGWKTVDEAKRRIEWLAGQNVEFIEQPMPATQLDDIAKLHDWSPLPIVADENSVRPEDVPGLSGVYHGINIKLMKCGGLTNALKMVALAQKHHLDLMMGCMVETSVAISAAAQIGSFMRWLDLDGNVLIANDPFIGVGNVAGKLILSNEPGIGVRRR